MNICYNINNKNYFEIVFEKKYIGRCYNGFKQYQNGRFGKGQ